MLFNTYTFAAFLCLVLGAYLVLPLRGRQVFLLAASYVFYCWEKPVYGLLLATSTCLDYVCGIWMGRLHGRRRRRLVLLLSLAGNLGLLGFFKYGDFLAGNIAGLGRLLGFDTHWKAMGFVLPVGISFYTFQTMSYTIQVYRRQIDPTRDFISFALYVSFFPQLVAGPIERANRLLPQLQVYHRIRAEDIAAGARRIVYGLFRKVVIADRLGILVDMFFENPDGFSTATAWIVMPVFMGQIYFDFAGYADIAIGTARLFGIRLTENFRRPLLSVSIGDFWNRWHITLTSWLRDYVFFPLGGFRKGGARTLLNGWIVFLLCGLWHGARWNFVAWGAYHAVLISFYFTWRFIKKRLKLGKAAGGRASLVILLSTMVTFCFTSFNTLFFRSESFVIMRQVCTALLGRHAGAASATQWYVWGFAMAMGVILVFEWFQEYSGMGARLRGLPRPIRVAGLTLLAVVTLLTAVNNSAPYIYFQF